MKTTIPFTLLSFMRKEGSWRAGYLDYLDVRTRRAAKRTERRYRDPDDRKRYRQGFDEAKAFETSEAGGEAFRRSRRRA
jgi:hypothetical protein